MYRELYHSFLDQKFFGVQKFFFDQKFFFGAMIKFSTHSHYIHVQNTFLIDSKHIQKNFLKKKFYPKFLNFFSSKFFIKFLFFFKNYLPQVFYPLPTENRKILYLMKGILYDKGHSIQIAFLEWFKVSFSLKLFLKTITGQNSVRHWVQILPWTKVDGYHVIFSW